MSVDDEPTRNPGRRTLHLTIHERPCGISLLCGKDRNASRQPGISGMSPRAQHMPNGRELGANNVACWIQCRFLADSSPMRRDPYRRGWCRRCVVESGVRGWAAESESPESRYEDRQTFELSTVGDRRDGMRAPWSARMRVQRWTGKSVGGRDCGRDAVDETQWIDERYNICRGAGGRHQHMEIDLRLDLGV